MNQCQQPIITITNKLRDLFNGFPPYFEVVKLNPAPLKSDSLDLFWALYFILYTD